MEKLHLEAICALFTGNPVPQKSHVIELKGRGFKLDQDDRDDLIDQNLNALNNLDGFLSDTKAYISKIKDARVCMLFECLIGECSLDEIVEYTEVSLKPTEATSPPQDSDNADGGFEIGDSTGLDQEEKPEKREKQKRKIVRSRPEDDKSVENDENDESGGETNEPPEPPWAEQVRRLPVGKARLDYRLSLMIGMSRWKLLYPLVLKEIEACKSLNKKSKRLAEEKLEARKEQLNAYVRGETHREQNRALGKYMLKMIKRVEEGLDPKSDEFAFYFVDGLARSYSPPT